MPTLIDPSARSRTETAHVPCIHVVDDDVTVQTLFLRLCAHEGYDVRTYGTVASFLTRTPEDRPGCLVLDLKLPDGTGIDLLRRLAEEGAVMPVVFMTGVGGVRDAVQALQLGSLDFVEKPFDLERMRDALQRGIELDLERRRRSLEEAELLRRFQTLTAREMEIMELIVQGASNKEAAWKLGLSPKTVEVHRASVMRKTGSHSLAELVRLHVAAQPLLKTTPAREPQAH